MSKENLRQFCLLVLGDSELQNQLKSFTDRDEFIARLIKSGEKNGFEFSREDVELQMRENRRFYYERWM